MNKFLLIIKDIFYIAKLTKVKNKKLRIVLTAIISNIIGFADIFIILIFSSVLTQNKLIENKLIESIIDFKYLIPGFIFLRYLLNYLGKYNIFSLTKDIEQSLKLHVLNQVYTKGNYSIADSAYAINTLSVHIAYFFNATANIVSSIFQIVVFTFYLSYGSYEILLILIVLVIVLYYPSKKILDYLRKFTESSYEFNKTNIKNIQRIIQNLYLIKVLKTFKLEKENFNNNLTNLYSVERKKYSLKDINTSFPNFIVMLAFSVLILFNRFRSSLTLDFLGVTIRLVQQLGSINSSLSGLVSSHVHLKELFKIEENNNSDSLYEKNIDKNSQNVVELKNIQFHFANSENAFFDNLSISFLKNKHHVITGVNGSGKSTLIAIMAGSLYPSSGSLTTSTDNVGYVGPEPFILDNTLRYNLTYGHNANVDDQILLNYIDEFKLFNETRTNVLDSFITVKSLSSGQMQKIAFIRALVSKCELLFLDESTANLDLRTKNLIFEILEKKKISIINCTHNPEDFNFDHHVHIEISSNEKRNLKIIK